MCVSRWGADVPVVSGATRHVLDAQGQFAFARCAVRLFSPAGVGRTLPAMTVTLSLEKQAVSPRDQLVFCPLRYAYVHFESCLGCDRLVRADENLPPRYVICDARMLERSDVRANSVQEEQL